MLPLATRFARAAQDWLAPWFGDLAIRPDLDAVPALSAEREALWARVGSAAFLSDAERRDLLGLGTEGAP